MKTVSNRCELAKGLSQSGDRAAAPTMPGGKVRSRPEIVHALTRGGCEGQSMVETALVLPLLLMMLLGILLLGITFNNYLTLTHAVNGSASDLQNGAGSIGLTAAAPYTDPCMLITTKAANYALGMKATNITYTIILNNALVYPAKSGTWEIGPKPGTFACANAPKLESHLWATVIATYPCSFTILGVDYAALAGGSSAVCLKAVSTVEII